MFKFMCKSCGSCFRVEPDEAEIVCKACGSVYARRGLKAMLNIVATEQMHQEMYELKSSGVAGGSVPDIASSGL